MCSRRQKENKKENSKRLIKTMALSFRPYFEGRIYRLVKNDILPPLKFSDLEQCTECIKEKYVKIIKKGAKRSIGILEIIHIDIRGIFLVKSVDGYDSFKTFTDDYSRYGYIYPIKERLEALDKFKIFKVEDGNQLDLKIKVVRSNREGVLWSAYTLWTKSLDLLQNICKRIA